MKREIHTQCVICCCSFGNKFLPSSIQSSNALLHLHIRFRITKKCKQSDSKLNNGTIEKDKKTKFNYFWNGMWRSAIEKVNSQKRNSVFHESEKKLEPMYVAYPTLKMIPSQPIKWPDIFHLKHPVGIFDSISVDWYSALIAVKFKSIEFSHSSWWFRCVCGIDRVHYKANWLKCSVLMQWDK